MSLISGGMQISNGGWDEMTTDERVGAVRDLVGALSFGNDFAKFGSNLIETLGGKREVPGIEGGMPRANATAWLGLLGDNFPDIWKSGADVKADLFAENISLRVDNGSRSLGNQGIPLDDLDENGRRNFDKLAENLGNQMIDTGTRSSGTDIAKKVGRSYLRFMGGRGWTSPVASWISSPASRSSRMPIRPWKRLAPVFRSGWVPRPPAWRLPTRCRCLRPAAAISPPISVVSVPA
ncbi:hypothetical protein CUR86_18935 [Salinicola acroporae]|uniref:Uncharacterized protein n=1 Tax=Salinicola acroporae TaxID=1541440 RepID=A0ABT6I9T2_9GAMM|nr:hypothetical protein [Salinicola acroporae]